jgi:hypothetical protein
VEAILLPGVHAVVSAYSYEETADVSVFYALMAFTTCALVYANAGAKSADAILDTRARFWTGLVLLSILLLSAATITTLDLDNGERHWTISLWFGYGPRITLIAVCAIPVVIALLRTDNRIVHVSLAALTYGAVLFFYLPSILQPPWGVVDMSHSPYVLNEVLAPQSGGYPLVNFTAQYTSLLGYAFNLLFNSRGTVDQGVWFLTILALLGVAISLAPLLRAFPNKKRYLAVLFTVPAVFIVKSPEDGYSSSLGILFSALPVRLIFPALIALMLATERVRNATLGASALLAFICSIAILNNFESGLVSTIAALMILTIACKPEVRIFRATRFLGLVVLSLGLQSLVIGFAYGWPSFRTLTAFVGGFGSGFGAWPMPAFGLWVFVFVFLSLGLIAATYHFRVVNQDDHSPHDSLSWRLGTIVFFWSAFGLGMSPYYINRSAVPGQLQFLLFPAFFAGAALLLLMRGYTRPSNRDMALIIAAIPAAISMASTVQHPSFALAMGRLRNVGAAIGQQYEAPVRQIKEKIAQIRSEQSDKQVGLFTDFGFLLATALHVRSYLPVNQQNDLWIMGESLNKQTCSFLQSNKSDIVISNVPLNEFALKMIESCGYVETEEFGSKSDGLIVLKRR